MEQYSKPEMKFVELRNRESVAEKCWGYHGTGYKYYDTVGTGYVSFTVDNGHCSGQGGAFMVIYYADQDSAGTPIYAGDPRYDEIYQKVIEASEGNYGSPFKGETNFPDEPGENWS